MNCHKVEEIIDAYIDDEVKDLDDSIKNHLSKCPSCKAIYEESLAVKSMLNNLDLVPLPDDFEETLHVKLMDSKVRPIYRNKVIKKVGFVATIAAVGVIAFMTGLNIDRPIDQLASDNDYAGMETANRNFGINDSGMNNDGFPEFSDDVAEESIEEGFAIQEAPDMDAFDQEADINVSIIKNSDQGVYTLTFSEALTSSDEIYHYKISSIDEFKIVEDILKNYTIFQLEKIDNNQMTFKIDSRDIGSLSTELIEETSVDFGVNVEFESIKTSELIKVIIELKED